MTPRRESRELGSATLAAAIALSISFCAAAPGAFAAEESAPSEARGDFSPGADRNSTRPPATFFTINAVLAKLERQSGRGPGALRTALLTPSNIANDVSPPIAEAPAIGTEPFGLFTFRAPESALWRKWRGIESDMNQEQTVLDSCRAKAENCPAYAAQFLRLIKAVKAKSGRDQLDEANRAVNIAIRYVSDFAQYGMADRWSTPLATFATGKGDCEDYAIAKYVALIEAGFPRDDLRLVLGRDRAIRQDHAVLAARLDGHWLILDSRRSDLLDDSEVTNLTPVFAINHRGVQLLAAPYVKRDLVAGDVEPVPAAASDGDPAVWTGQDASDAEVGQLNSLPLFL
jgi:predicted transglutaminase-like cysteine proteinase